MSNAPISRHRRASTGTAARGQRQFRAGLCVSAVLLMGVGFGLQQTVGTSAGSTEGTSTVAAQPDLADRAPTASASAATTGAAGSRTGAGGKAGPARVSASAPSGPATGKPASGQGGAAPATSGTAPSALPVAPAVPAAPAAAGDPFASARLYVDPDSTAARAVASLRASDPTGAQTLARLADQAHADWFGDPDPNTVRTRVAARAQVVRAAGAMPLFVAYAIPQRDCGGGQSAGGVGDEAAYRAWITAFAAGLGHGAAAVIVEPDALAQIDCMPAAAAAARYAMLNYAVDVLTATGANVYLDAGHADWHSAAEMAGRLRLAGVDRARGFALNVSNFDETADETAYGDAVVAALGGRAHYVIDTSRNGRGPAAGDVWCNPPGRGLGAAPTAATGNPRADAYLWIKVPGESDGACNGGPGAGQWWLDYALGLASRAA
ncbi:glycoside hydrolase family 6 protein [Frankia sp. Ag45/Mut15]|uniref:Glucanase n=1 Tax=Frankia umida TaxID=573489 RepID=A0ABT0JUT0_9ACTN|nr:glycoside hydrolase family 6 protein [Frankia umida]MCK9875296.1 glycoside hydrolase family 6 protein [Frankia umida]